MISVIDYGSGNLKAILNIYKRLNIPAKVVSDPAQILASSKLLLPGVGAFDSTMKMLNSSGLRASLDEMVLNKRVPILGICVGMQVMAKGSDEGIEKGLGWFDANVKKLDASTITRAPRLPHMGWNNIKICQQNSILTNIDCEIGFYFLHSYYFDCNDHSDVLAEVEYGSQFPCAVVKDNIFGFQFHPEKSHHNGVNLFKNFAEVNPC